MWYLGSTPIVERNYGLVFSAFFFTSLAVVTVGMRIYTRVVLLRNIGVDDVLITIALVGAISYLTACMEQIRFGLGDAVRFEELQSFLIALYVTVLSYSFTQMMVKFSILFQYRRIFQTTLAKRISLGVMLWFIAYGSVCLGTSIFTCWPIRKYWNDEVEGGCIDRSVLHYFLAGFNILNDFILLFLPMPFLKKLHVNPRVKAVLIGVFACGGFACIVAIIRLRSLYVNNSAPIEEQPLYGVDIALWSCLEINIAMICASVPSLKPLFIKIIPALNSSGDGSKPTNLKGYGYGYGRSGGGGSVPLQSFDNNIGVSRNRDVERDGNASSGSETLKDHSKMEIKVHQTFEMRTIETEDDGSEKDLVTTSWAAADHFPGGTGGHGAGGVSMDGSAALKSSTGSGRNFSHGGNGAPSIGGGRMAGAPGNSS
ncbi:hypothetical protein B0H66DRAFT_74012 [Apodospora peruviana]|uniref:Rhodopsin domain-containing protein n=1 Tax=Apodospora peruviana TaxID=516989 RepID=A0AAE0IT86_9PEZI|nr:hypothetical protein B0H66DRAFT_74012 [Apodospora peruviana]